MTRSNRYYTVQVLLLSFFIGLLSCSDEDKQSREPVLYHIAKVSILKEEGNKKRVVSHDTTRQDSVVKQKRQTDSHLFPTEIDFESAIYMHYYDYYEEGYYSKHTLNLYYPNRTLVLDSIIAKKSRMKKENTPDTLKKQ